VVKVALRAFGFTVKKQEVLQLILRHADNDNADVVDYEIFEHIVGEKMSGRSAEEELQRAFKLFDVEGTGVIDLRILKKIVKHLAMDIDEAQLRDMIDEFDQDK
jgi:centrin-3